MKIDGATVVDRPVRTNRGGRALPDLLAFTQTNRDTGEDVWILSMTGNRVTQPFLESKANESAPDISPDSRWIAYSSDESGREEIYLLPAQGSGGKRQVSTEGGLLPHWRADGRELFYLQGDRMMVVETHIDEDVELGLPQELFQLSQGLIAGYDVTPDGQRFLMVDASESEPPPTEIVLVQNWFSELERLVPTDR